MNLYFNNNLIGTYSDNKIRLDEKSVFEWKPLLSEKEENIFKIIGEVADALHVEAYLVGGFVRDKIINRSTKDADIVCMGDGIALANAVAERFTPKPYVAFFKNNNASIIFL